MANWIKKICCALALVTGVAMSADDDVVEHDNSRISIFLQPAISFLSFEEREYFQDAIDTIYRDFMSTALDEAESLTVAKQDFQKVNFCFPITGGLQFQLMEDHFISAGLGFIYDDESVVLTDRKNKTHNFSYTIQGIPLFLEYRLAIPTNFMTLSDGSLFSVAVRWYWALPGTEIYTTWGKLEAEKSIFGSGFGLSLGYMFASWKNFNIFGDIGFSSISVKSKKTFADIVPNGPDEKAKWDIGGLQLQIRVSFGVWNKPVPKDDEDDDDDKDSTKVSVKKDSTAIKSDSLKVSGTDSTAATKPDSLASDSTAALVKDSTAKDSTAADSTQTIKNDAVKADSATTEKPSAASAEATATENAAKAENSKTEPSPDPAADKIRKKNAERKSAPKRNEAR